MIETTRSRIVWGAAFAGVCALLVGLDVLLRRSGPGPEPLPLGFGERDGTIPPQRVTYRAPAAPAEVRATGAWDSNAKVAFRHDPAQVAAVPGGEPCELGAVVRCETTSAVCLACHESGTGPDIRAVAPVLPDDGGDARGPAPLPRRRPGRVHELPRRGRLRARPDRGAVRGAVQGLPPEGVNVPARAALLSLIPYRSDR